MKKRFAAMLPLLLGLLLTGCAETPQSAYETTVQAAKAGKYGEVWDRFDKQTQGRFDAFMTLARVPLVMKLTVAGDTELADQISNASGKQLFTLLAENSPQVQQQMSQLEANVKSATIDGDQATLTVTNDGKTETVKLLKEDGRWKISLGEI